MDKKRVIVIAFCNFPRGSATANYIQYLSKALVACEYDVVLVTNINSDFHLLESEGFYHYDDIAIINAPQDKQNGILIKIARKVFKYNVIERILSDYNISKEDIVITYFQDAILHDEVFRLKKKIGFKTIACVTEWFSDDYFSDSRRLKDYKKHFYKWLPLYDLILPISTYLEKHFKSLGCETLRIPIMADANEFVYIREESDKIRFIFPGNGRIKDDLKSVLRAFEQIDDYYLEKIEFHICGMKRESIKELMGSDNQGKINKILVIHDWMQYDELIDLYRRMDYLILIRSESQITLSNFPSKVPECMTHGIVPIVSDVGDYTKLYLKNGVNSIFITENTIASIKNAIENAIILSDQERLRMSMAARKLVEDVFDYNNWIPVIKNKIGGYDEFKVK